MSLSLGTKRLLNETIIALLIIGYVACIPLMIANRKKYKRWDRLRKKLSKKYRRYG